jgi:hypothetical protein
MDLERIEIELRPRGPWEAADLGCLLVRRWPAALYGGWLVTAVPVFALSGLLFRAHPGWAWLIAWWFKPLYERLPMWLLSQRIFGSSASFADVRSNWRALVADLPAMLTYRRLAPARSFDAPVAVLERLTHRKRSTRVALLRRAAGSQGFWLTVIGVHVESFFFIGAALFAFMLVPSDVDLDAAWLLKAVDDGQFAWTANLLYFAAFGLVGPIYAAAGFTLYLNRRIELEGWDIELEFRRLTARLGRGAAGLLLVLPLFFALAPKPADAAVDTSATDESKAMIDSVLAEPQFNEVHVVSVPEFMKGLFEPSEPRPQARIGWLDVLVKFVAAFGEVLLWIVVAVLAGMLGYRLWRAPWFREPDSEHELPRRIVGSAAGDGAMTRDVVGAANEAWAAGEPRRAVALLYRGALAALTTQGCRFHEGDTEGDCLQRARGVVTESAFAGLARLTHVWQRLAYAHRRPDDDEFAQLCAAWRVFQPSSKR